MGGLWRGVGQLKGAGYRAKQRRGAITLSSRAIRKQADPPYTTTAPGREEHSQMGCAVTMAETERERNGVHRDDRCLVSGLGGSTKGLRVAPRVQGSHGHGQT